MTLTILPDAVAAALDAPVPGARISVEAAGIPWSTLVWGAADARPLLLIHGVTSSAAVWWRLGPALAVTGRRVIALDQAGHGRTGHWQGHHRFRDNAADIAAFIRAAGLDRTELQVVGHSWGAVTSAALPVAGIRPATTVLLDPPVLPFGRISLEASDPSQQPAVLLADALAAVRAAEPGWTDRDVQAKAEAVMELDLEAARAVLLDNGDWDGGLADLRDPAATGLDVWLVRGDPATGGYVDDDAAAAFAKIIGSDHVLTIAGAPHSPQRTHPRETVACFLGALGPA
ncbi:MAG TPA: alpha/beta fold hydrolase [Candidatus Limnocylindrales bacterium]|nr:alpha/beta fold hydrolase [Candidatus Limnocylindrales bacterium]